jgi:hypothetical protein
VKLTFPSGNAAGVAKFTVIALMAFSKFQFWSAVPLGENVYWLRAVKTPFCK